MRPDGQSQDSPRFDVLALGESMLTLYRDRGTAPDAFAWDVCGAESNVARYCAALGLRSGWVSRLGTGMAGSLVHDVVAGSGVDTSLVELCDRSPTGLMLRDSPERGQQVEYYRRGSAASLMSPEAIPVEACLETRALHLTGITPALSDGCRRLVEGLLREPSDALRSFDLNWRPALWPDGPPSRMFLEVANLADIVFVGLDEASEVWGHSDPAQVRAALPGPGIVVVKDDATGVHTFAGEDALFEPALRGPIVALMGAGDAFAAGFLSGVLAHPEDLRRCQRLGHVVAMSAITSELDVGPLPEKAEIDAMLDLSDDGWRELVYPGPASPASRN
ncbi:MAG: sugar kinase [Acidimicrobiaceae bacterium]|nr:sugar kinase [Acidimicrobiaceae bacterium]